MGSFDSRAFSVRPAVRRRRLLVGEDSLNICQQRYSDDTLIVIIIISAIR